MYIYMYEHVYGTHVCSLQIANYKTLERARSGWCVLIRITAFWGKYSDICKSADI